MIFNTTGDEPKNSKKLECKEKGRVCNTTKGTNFRSHVSQKSSRSLETRRSKIQENYSRKSNWPPIAQFGHFRWFKDRTLEEHTSDAHKRPKISHNSFHAIFKFLACKRKLASEQNFPSFIGVPVSLDSTRGSCSRRGGCVPRIRSLDRKQKFDRNTLKGNEESGEPGDG